MKLAAFVKFSLIFGNSRIRSVSYRAYANCSFILSRLRAESGVRGRGMLGTGTQPSTGATIKVK